ncbi:hypothetical protein ACFQ1S_36540 [Kibdelosporangium lantanae]|uniref:GlcNAc-PI de-N-acetylase n=1 Tax=Kibdelosporangium lantanae TaxID=1497396 RepID=A0ABW3MKS6_9PSEU
MVTPSICRALAVVAHPDDESFGLGAALDSVRAWDPHQGQQA